MNNLFKPTRWRNYLPTVIWLFVILTTMPVLVACRSASPTYEGHSLAYWLDNYNAGKTDEEWKAFITHQRSAIQNAGADAIPTLMSLLSIRDPSGTDPKRAGSAHHKHQMARQGFFWLGERSKTALPSIIQLVHDGNPEVSYDALLTVINIKLPKDTLLKILLDAFNCKTIGACPRAAVELHQKFPQQAEEAGVYAQFPSLKTLGYLN